MQHVVEYSHNARFHQHERLEAPTAHHLERYPSARTVYLRAVTLQSTSGAVITSGNATLTLSLQTGLGTTPQRIRRERHENTRANKRFFKHKYYFDIEV